jgi:hypothetical protein
MKVHFGRVAPAVLVVLRIWISSLVLSALSLGVAALLGGLNLNTIVKHLRDGTEEVPSTYPLKIARPIWWLGANQPGVQLLRIVPGASWVPESLSAVSASWGSVIALSDGALSLSEIADRGIRESDGAFNTQTVTLISRQARKMREPLERLRGLIDFAEVDRGPFWQMPKHAEVHQQFRNLYGAAGSGIETLSVAESLLLSEKPRMVFVGITNPAETRGLQGIIGQYALVEVSRLGVNVIEIESNLALRDPQELPKNLSAGYTEFYGANNPEWQNMTLSPFVDDAAEQISAAWMQWRGNALDAVVLLDTVTLARLATVYGDNYMSAQGRLLETPQALSDYLSNGLYLEFPIDNLERKKFQTDLGRRMVDTLLKSLDNPQPLVRPLAVSIIERRIAFWINEQVGSEKRPLISADQGTVIVGLDSESFESNQIVVRLNNFSGNKMDFYLKPSLQVEWCDSAITATVQLRNLAPPSEELPDYVLRRLDPVSSNPASLVGISFTVGSDWRIEQWSEDDLGIDPIFVEDLSLQRLRIWVEIPIGQERNVSVTVSQALDSNVSQMPNIDLAPLSNDWSFDRSDCGGG